MSYNKNNIFARILRGEIPAEKVYEDDHAMAFKDINPKAPIHVLVVPKGEYANSREFFQTAQEKEIIGFYRAVGEIIKALGLQSGSGYRLMSNTGPDAGQEVEHFHVHIFAGKPLGPMISV